ncbi:hypothetical protein POM88_025330 [Heracleum sosnowskyi]|uniref:P53 and DNA damage-regulated protein 1 n=1 Tax=Heracleum sosnowskyi TaxID=360622 RepID=A0AAD8MMB7_9APIA|nr:hypothetical protein POM88_025330 [Heracleum sosnowskyi]
MDDNMKKIQENLIEIEAKAEAEAEHLLLARHQMVENDKLRNGNREALPALRKRARTTKTSVPSPFESVMKEIEGMRSKPLVIEVCATCGNHDSTEKTWMMFVGTDIFARIPFHSAHTILEKVSTLSLGYTLDKKVEWTDAFVLLRGITTQTVRFSRMQSHVLTGFYLTPDAPHVPHPICLSLLPKWRDVSKSIREGKSTYSYNYYDYDDDKIRSAGVCEFSSANSVQLIDDGDRTKGKKFRRRNDYSNGQMDRSKMNSKYEKFTGQAAPALGASPNLGVDKTKSLELCGTSEAAYPGNSDVFRRTLAAASLGASQKSIESSATSESANSGMSHVFRTTLAAPASGATHKVGVSIYMCFLGVLITLTDYFLLVYDIVNGKATYK